MKKSIIILLALAILPLSACVSTLYQGRGTVVAQHKIHGKDFKAHEYTYNGMKAGASVGAIGGSAVGGLFGFFVGASTGPASPLFSIPFTVVGAGVGAILFGSVGGIMGGSAGYVVDLVRPDVGTYQYTVKLDETNKTYLVTQYSRMIPVGSPVRVFETEEVRQIRRIP